MHMHIYVIYKYINKLFVYITNGASQFIRRDSHTFFSSNCGTTSWCCIKILFIGFIIVVAEMEHVLLWKWKKNTHLIKSLRLSEKICYILTHKNLILFLVQKLIKNTVINGTWMCERVWGSVGGSTCSIIESELNWIKMQLDASLNFPKSISFCPLHFNVGSLILSV